MIRHGVSNFVNPAYLDRLVHTVYVAEDAGGICHLPTFSNEELHQRGIGAVEAELRTKHTWFEKLGMITASFNDSGRIRFQGSDFIQLTLRSSRKLVPVYDTDELEFKAVSWNADCFVC